MRTLLLICLVGWGTVLFAQPDGERFNLPRRTMPIEKALLKLTQAGAELTYRPDQIPQQVIRVPGGKRTLPNWLEFLLRDTELTFESTPAGYLIYVDPDLSSKSFNVYGVITDRQSGERLLGAAVQVMNEEVGALTNEYGFYSLPLSGGRHLLRASYIGYEPVEVELVLRADTLVDIPLRADRELPAVIVRARPRQENADVYLGDTRASIGREEVGRIGGPGGEADPLRVARFLPGVETGADGLGGIFVRGSEAGHNLVLLDGVPVYNLNHAAGLFSIFSNQAIRRLDLYKDGIPARFGGRIGGVLDVHTRDGNQYAHGASVGTSMLAGHFAGEGPIVEGESSYLATGRYFWAGDILRSASRNYKESLGRAGQLDYQVYDVNFKLNQRVGERGRVYLSFYRGVDDYGNTSSETDTVTVLNPAGAVFRYAAPRERADLVRWGNTVGALRYNHVFSERFFGNFRFSYSDLIVDAAYERSDSLNELSNNIPSGEVFSGRYASDIRQFGLAFDGQYRTDNGLELRFGGEANQHGFLPQLRSGGIPLRSQPGLSETGDGDWLRPRQYVVYGSAAGRWRGVFVRAGARVQWWEEGSRGRYVHLSPRVLLAGNLSPQTSWRLTYDQSVQPVHLVSSTVIGLPSDLWIPSTENLAPATSWQIAGQLSRNFGPHYNLEAGAYFRRMDGLVEYTEGGLQDDWLEALGQGKGQATGLELTLSRTGDRFQGWATYTLAESTREFDERINLGRPFQFRYGRRHSLKLVGLWTLSPRTSLAATWRYGSGARYSLSAESFLFVDPSVEGDPDAIQRINLVSERNGFKLPANHRLDINAQFKLGKRKDARFRHRLDVGIYNVYDRHNPVYYEIRTDYFSRGEQLVADREFVQVFLAPFTPTFSYHLSFGSRKRTE